jgi:hypothetical protein
MTPITWRYEAEITGTHEELLEMALWLSENLTDRFVMKQVTGWRPHNKARPDQRTATVEFFDLADAAKFKLFFGDPD